MRFIVALTLALATMAGAFQIPKGSYNLGQLAKAQELAAREGKPIAFVIVQKAMTAT